MKKLLWTYLVALLGTANASERWWEIQLAGEPAGYQHSQLVSREGESLWVITTEGQDAGVALDRIAEGWRWLSWQ